MKKLKSKAFTKKMMALLLCSSMLFSMPTGISSVQATQVKETQELVPYGTSGDSTDTVNVDANGTLGTNSDVGLTVAKSISGTAGKKVKMQFKVLSNNKTSIKLKNLYPVIDATFPFETSGDAYKVVSAGSDASKQQTLSANFTMKARSDVETGYHSVRFIAEYTKTASDGTTADYYVIKTINVYLDGVDPVSDAGDTYVDPYEDDEDDDDSESGGNSYNTNNYYGNDDDDDDDSATEVSAPKLIITGFETKPKKVMAGETFTLTIHVKNTSKTTSLCNGKFLIGNEAGTFLPTNGSSAVFVESIAAEKTGDLKIELKTSADLAQKNYNLLIKGDFDDGKGNNFTSSDSLSIPVYQEIKLGLADITMSPDMIGIGEAATLMFTINNQSKAGVYNLSVSVKDDAVTCEDTFVGNIAASASAYATLNLTGASDNSDTGTITVLLSYEDAEGNKNEYEQQIACYVGEDVVSDEYYDDEYYDEEYYDEEYEEGIPLWLIIVIAVAGVILLAVIIILVVRSKKKRMAALLEDGEDDIENEDI